MSTKATLWRAFGNIDTTQAAGLLLQGLTELAWPHVRPMLEAAWEEGAQAAYDSFAGHGDPTNPYRGEAD